MCPVCQLSSSCLSLLSGQLALNKWHEQQQQLRSIMFLAQSFQQVASHLFLMINLNNYDIFQSKSFLKQYVHMSKSIGIVIPWVCIGIHGRWWTALLTNVGNGKVDREVLGYYLHTNMMMIDKRSLWKLRCSRYYGNFAITNHSFRTSRKGWRPLEIVDPSQCGHTPFLVLPCSCDLSVCVCVYVHVCLQM